MQKQRPPKATLVSCLWFLLLLLLFYKERCELTLLICVVLKAYSLEDLHGLYNMCCTTLLALADDAITSSSVGGFLIFCMKQLFILYEFFFLNNERDFLYGFLDCIEYRRQLCADGKWCKSRINA